jgi:hypothetical protein
MILARVLLATAAILLLALAVPVGVAALAYGHRTWAYGLTLGSALVISLGLFGGSTL